MDKKKRSFGATVRRAIMGRNDKGERARLHRKEYEVRRERERALEILQEETGTGGTQSEIERVTKALREKKLK